MELVTLSGTNYYRTGPTVHFWFQTMLHQQTQQFMNMARGPRLEPEHHHFSIPAGTYNRTTYQYYFCTHRIPIFHLSSLPGIESSNSNRNLQGHHSQFQNRSLVCNLARAAAPPPAGCDASCCRQLSLHPLHLNLHLLAHVDGARFRPRFADHCCGTISPTAAPLCMINCAIYLRFLLHIQILRFLL